jgi:hypothetical protein
MKYSPIGLRNSRTDTRAFRNFFFALLPRRLPRLGHGNAAALESLVEHHVDEGLITPLNLMVVDSTGTGTGASFTADDTIRHH